MNPIALQTPLRRTAQQTVSKSRAYSSFYPSVKVPIRYESLGRRTSFPISRHAPPINPRGSRLNNHRVPRQRSLNTTKHNNTRHDESTMDFAYMPRGAFFPESRESEPRVPLLPDNFSPPVGYTNQRDVHIESVVRPTISTVSADGTHIDSPSAMSDVTDNHAHAQDVDVFDLTRKVTSAAKNTAAEFSDIAAAEVEKQGSGAKAVWEGFLDDLLGPKQSSRT